MLDKKIFSLIKILLPLFLVAFGVFWIESIWQPVFSSFGLLTSKHWPLVYFLSAIIFQVVISYILPHHLSKSGTWMRSILYVGLFFLMRREVLWDSFFLLALLAIFALGKYGSRRLIRIFTLISFPLLFLPFGLYLFHETRGALDDYVLFVHISFGIRIFLYFSDYLMKGFPCQSRLPDFLEYFYCPFFFLCQSMVYPIGPKYFFASRAQNKQSLKTNAVLGVWALICYALYSSGAHFFQSHIVAYFSPNAGYRYIYLLSGIVWVFLWYFHHTCGMGIQVLCARSMGYHIKYDMDWPFLSRSPLEFFRRSHTYIRDFVLEYFYRPLLLYFLRWGLPLRLSIFAAALVGYSAIIFMFLGWRINELDRPIFIGGAMILTLSIALFFSIINLDPRATREANNFLGQVSSSFKEYHWRDFVYVILTILFFSLTKIAILWLRVHF